MLQQRAREMTFPPNYRAVHRGRQTRPNRTSPPSVTLACPAFCAECQCLVGSDHRRRYITAGVICQFSASLCARAGLFPCFESDPFCLFPREQRERDRPGIGRYHRGDSAAGESKLENSDEYGNVEARRTVRWRA
jgi:hypothetical protein